MLGTNRSISRIAMCVVAVAGSLGASTIDFEGVSLGTKSSLLFPDVTITYTGGNGNFDVVDASPGPPISGHSLLSFFDNPGPSPFRATFNILGVRMFQIGVGDFDADEDHTHLAVYSAGNVLLGSADYINPASTFGGDYLTVNTSADIAYALFWEDGTNSGAVYWDNLSYSGSAVPEPSSFVSFLIGIAGLAAFGRNRISKSRS